MTASQSSPTSDAPDLLRMPKVMQQTGLGRSTIYRLIAERRFPKAVRLTGRAVGWRAADLRQWVDSRPTADSA